MRIPFMRFRSYSAVSPFSVPPFYGAGRWTDLGADSILRTLVFESASVIILPLLLGLNGIWGCNYRGGMYVRDSVSYLLVAKRRRYQYF